MKKIEFNIASTACVPNFQEAFILAPLMDLLIDNINYRRACNKRDSIDRVEREKYKWCTNYNTRLKEDINVERIYQILVEHGYCGTGNQDLLPDGYPLELKEQTKD